MSIFKLDNMTTLLENKTPTKSEMEPYLMDIYETYCLWKSLPALFKYPPKDKNGISPTPRDFAEQMGIDDDKLLDLVTIRNQTAFAERFHVHIDTLTDWNKTIRGKDSMNELRSWATHLSKNVLVSLYNNAIRKGMALEAKLWFQLVEQWQEKTKVAHELLGDIQFNITLNKPKEEQNANQLGTVNQADAGLGTPQQ
jgi:hypothetical protein